MWHQPIVAFLYYSFVGTLDIVSFLCFILITAGIGVGSYIVVEKNLPKLFLNTDKNWHKMVAWGTASLLLFCLLGVSGLVYLNAGVVRDVPELGVQKGSAHRGMHAEYGDRPYDWNHDFTQEDKIKILVIGNSYGRDWANILLKNHILYLLLQSLV